MALDLKRLYGSKGVGRETNMENGWMKLGEMISGVAQR
jgi:hypothetical protein